MSWRFSLTQITHLGTQTGYLQLPDVIAVGTTSITLLYLVGSICHIPVFCPTHQAYHCIGVWASCTDPERSILVFDASLEFSLGISEQYDEYMLELDENHVGLKGGLVNQGRGLSLKVIKSHMWRSVGIKWQLSSIEVRRITAAAQRHKSDIIYCRS